MKLQLAGKDLIDGCNKIYIEESMGCTNDHIVCEQVPPASNQGMIAPRKNSKLDEATTECAITKCYKKLLYPQLAVWLGV